MFETDREGAAVPNADPSPRWCHGDDRLRRARRVHGQSGDDGGVGPVGRAGRRNLSVAPDAGSCGDGAERDAMALEGARKLRGAARQRAIGWGEWGEGDAHPRRTGRWSGRRVWSRGLKKAGREWWTGTDKRWTMDGRDGTGLGMGKGNQGLVMRGETLADAWRPRWQVRRHGL